MLQEWNRLDLTPAQRVSDLRTVGVLNGQFKLNSATVIDDGAKDTLSGGPDGDWFWATGAGLTRDVTDNTGAEQVK